MASIWFKQLSFFRLSADFVIDLEKLNGALAANPFQPCNGLDWFSQGWIPPASHLDSHVYRHRDYSMVSLHREDKVLPAGVIADHLEKKVEQIEAQELRKVGRKEKTTLKEQITDDLLPRAFTKFKRTTAYIDSQRGWLMVNSSTASKAENLVSTLREALPPFPAALPRTNLSAHSVMTDWLAASEASNGFELDNEATLKDSSENGAIIKVKRQDLTADEIRDHIQAGKQVTELGLIYRERIRFVLTDKLQLKKLQFLDVLQEEASQAGDDLASLFEATFLLMAEELGDLIDALTAAMGGVEESQAHANVTMVQNTASGNADSPWSEPTAKQSAAADQTYPDTDDNKLYQEAVKTVKISQTASISHVQRVLRIGFNRAARLIERMEHEGIVSAMESNGSRSVLVQ
ncbi:recombination-associated protein RdgC [Vogesella sp. XCS3]|uniref:recombination-associated protein RdgC n=1 Tax=Vogesella sp. XCS3 TaxID=2877939 RepID=UPI001D09A5DD|nr:recombination-associated protein RdgC [Vogesella sp. XCS3]UDM18860.1 recombination-associated protein RdgC [Vogesella sp. XCS3]